MYAKIHQIFKNDTQIVLYFSTPFYPTATSATESVIGDKVKYFLCNNNTRLVIKKTCDGFEHKFWYLIP